VIRNNSTQVILRTNRTGLGGCLNKLLNWAEAMTCGSISFKVNGISAIAIIAVVAFVFILPWAVGVIDIFSLFFDQ
jgi:hypothetical protein